MAVLVDWASEGSDALAQALLGAPLVEHLAEHLELDVAAYDHDDRSEQPDIPLHEGSLQRRPTMFTLLAQFTANKLFSID